MAGQNWTRSDRRRTKPTRPVWPTLQRAVGLLRRYRLIVLGYIFTIMLSSVAGLGQPLLIKQLIDYALPEKDGDQLNLLILAIVGLIVLVAANSTLQSYLSNLAAHGVMFDLRSRIYKRLTGMSLR